MGYGGESRGPLIQPDATWQAAIAMQTAADKAYCPVLEPCTVLRIGVYVTTALTVTAIVVDFDRRITPGSDTGRVDQGVGRITAPAAAQAAGVVLYKDVNVDLNPGDEIVFALNTASTAGGGIPFMVVVPRAEVPANFADMVASA